MLRSIFIGSPNRFTELIVHWLSKHSLLAGVVWTYSSYWHKSLSGQLKFTQKRLNRFGVLKTLDETLYYLLYRFFLNESGEPFQSRLCDAYSHEYGQPDWHGESIDTHDINSPDVLRFVRERSPDLIMSMCINEFFRCELREIPRLGAFLWHEGLVPEYKGLYSPFWAIHNGQPEMLGFTVLRMNGRYDEGEVFLQGRVLDVDPRSDSPIYIGHKAILESLPHVANLFSDLEQGTTTTISTQGRQPGYYTYPGLSDWFSFRRAVQLLRNNHAGNPELNSELRTESVRDRP